MTLGTGRPSAIAAVAACLLWSCGPTEPQSTVEVATSFTGTATPGVCTFVFTADATPEGATISYSYELKVMRLIAPTTWAAYLYLEGSSGSFNGSLRLSWDASLATQSQVGRFIRFQSSAGDGSTNEIEHQVVCPQAGP